MKKILLAFIFSLLLLNNTYGANVEDVFSDITKDYKYYNELQNLYDKGMIKPTPDGKFKPKSYITRDDFVGIVSEVGCKSCIQPNISFSTIKKYADTNTFFDINKNNKNYYCVAESIENGTIKGYAKGTKCKNGTQKDGQAPFCPENNITKEEALAILLRNSSIFSIQENQNIINNINSGIINKDLSSDVKAKLKDGSAYGFYGFFQKALDYELVEYDTYGNENKYKLVQLDQNNMLNPKALITREKLLSMAYIIFKSNSCKQKPEDFKISSQIKTTKLKCNTAFCSDFELDAIKPEKVDPDYKYKWYLYNETTFKQITEEGKKVDKVSLDDGGKWTVKLSITKDDKVISTATSSIDTTKNINIDIKCTPNKGVAPLKVNCRPTTTDPSFKYIWDISGLPKTGPETGTQIFDTSGLYPIKLTVLGEDGYKSDVETLVEVTDIKCSSSCSCPTGRICSSKNTSTCSENGICLIDKSKLDSDKDGVVDLDDKCLFIPGVLENEGCPIVGEECNLQKKCSAGYQCEVGKCVYVGTYNNNKNELDECLSPKGSSVIYGKAVCKTCPCDNHLDFNAEIRKCDVIFPAIVSPDGKTIYSKGPNWLVK